MLVPPLPADEDRRLRTLQGLGLLDTEPEERFDRLTRLARRLFDVPIALVSIIDCDRQWFKSRQGLDATETPRDVSFCGHAILGSDVFVVPDTLIDPRFADNPLVTGEPSIRFYAGCPVSTPDGARLGTLCVIDRRPRSFGPDDIAALRDLAQVAEQELAAVQLATLDELTGLSNRRGFIALAAHTLSLCRRAGAPALLLYFDLEGFKQINDRFGHAAGDRALVDFAMLLKQSLREVDVIGRVGGDDFVVLLAQSGAGSSAGILRRLAQHVDAHDQQHQRGYALRYSVGAVSFDPARDKGIEDLLARADLQMYERKRAKGQMA